MRNYIFIFCIICITRSNLSIAQTYLGFEFNPSIPVIKNGQPLKNPWAGGINYGQFSNIDYNFDGLNDLVIFDRSGDEFILLEHTVNGSDHQYEYVYNGAQYFPADCKYRAAFLDYDMDGKNDLFTYGIGGIKVYKNVGDVINGLQWNLIKPIVQTNYLGTLTNLFVSASDIPAYVDVDFDGDIDVLTFHLGGQNLEYHQNQSMELYGIPDSLVFALKNQCWGKFSEDESSNNLSLNQTAYPCSNGDVPNPQYPIHDVAFITDEIKLHVGSTVLGIDINNNGVMDLILGDVAYSSITLLINGGSAPNTNSPMISQNHQFPNATNPGEMNLFPATYFVDVDLDGIKDLVVAPNARTVSENQSSVQFFKNTGTNFLPVFSYQSNDHLQHDMIDHGLGSIPVLVDVDGDGLKDLVVSNFIRYKPVLDKESALQLYKNTGTATNPQFTLSDNDFLGLSSQNLGLRIVPTFGDLDNDGDLDLIIGSEYGSLKRFTNTAGVGNLINLSGGTDVNDQNGNPIHVVSYSYPQLFDLNKDGLLDLIIGKKTGEISYYQNTGTSSTPQFTLISENLGNVDVSSTPDGYAAPHFFRENDTTHLFVGAYSGNLLYYNQIDGNLANGNTFHLYSSNYLNIDVGLYSSFYVGDIDNDGLLSLFVGQDLGGLFHFEANPASTASLTDSKMMKSFSLFPNPGNSWVSISMEQSNEVRILGVYNLLGQKQHVELSTTGFQAEQLASGTYFVVLEVNQQLERLSFIKQ